MPATRKRTRPRLASARAYYRLAGKASRAGEIGTAEHYRKVADRLVDQDRRDQESRKLAAKRRAQPRPATIARLE